MAEADSPDAAWSAGADTAGADSPERPGPARLTRPVPQAAGSRFVRRRGLPGSGTTCSRLSRTVCGLARPVCKPVQPVRGHLGLRTARSPAPAVLWKRGRDCQTLLLESAHPERVGWWRGGVGSGGVEMDLRASPAWAAWVFAVVGTGLLPAVLGWMRAPSMRRRGDALLLGFLLVAMLALNRGADLQMLWYAGGFFAILGFALLPIGRLPPDVPLPGEPACQTIARRGHLTSALLVGGEVARSSSSRLTADLSAGSARVLARCLTSGNGDIDRRSGCGSGMPCWDKGP